MLLTEHTVMAGTSKQGSLLAIITILSCWFTPARSYGSYMRHFDEHSLFVSDLEASYVSLGIRDRIIMGDQCGGTIDLGTDGRPAGWMTLTASENYKMGWECTVIIKAPLGHALAIVFTSIDIRETDGSCADSLMIYDGDNETQSPLTIPGGLCMNGADDLESNRVAYYSYGQFMKLDFRSQEHSSLFTYRGFTLLYTVAKHASKCSQNEFRCKVGICIPNSVQCDSLNNCGDESDEKDENGNPCGMLSVGAIAGIVIGVIALLVLFSAIITCIVRRISHEADDITTALTTHRTFPSVSIIS